MSAVPCLPACLCLSAAASRGQAPHGDASPGGKLLLGLPTLLTTHHVNAEEDTSAKQLYALKQTYSEL